MVQLKKTKLTINGQCKFCGFELGKTEHVLWSLTLASVWDMDSMEALWGSEELFETKILQMHPVILSIRLEYDQAEHKIKIAASMPSYSLTV